MSYAGMGATAFSLTPSAIRTPTPPSTSADKGALPADLVSAMASPLVNAGFADSDAAGQKLRVLGVLLAALARNAKGAPVSAQAVLSLLTSATSPPGGNGWVNNAFASSDYAPLRSMTVESIIADITGGKYKASAPTSTTFKAAPLLRLTGGSTLLTPAPSSSAPPPVSAAQPEVQCTDGYFRDASGLCVPNAAPPGAAAQPDISQLPSPVVTPPMVDDQSGYGPPPAVTSTPGSVSTPGTALPRWTQSSPLGVSLKWWALGVAGMGVAAIAYRSSKKSVVANKRRRRKRS